MTNDNYTNQIISFYLDLDENISETVVWNDDSEGEMTTFYFHNPVTGSVDTVSFFEDFDTHPIIYVPNFSLGRTSFKDQIEVADLEELYEYILIEEQ